jgi:hypothetical protein
MLTAVGVGVGNLLDKTPFSPVNANVYACKTWRRLAAGAGTA